VSSFAPIVDIGEHAARGAADLLSDVLATADSASRVQIGTEARSILDAARERISRGEYPRAKAQSLADASQHRLSTLSSFRTRLDTLEEALRADIFQLKAILEEQYTTAQTPDVVACRALVEQRLAHLAHVEASLARCRILLQQLSRGEHLCSDTLGLMRDVTVPMAARHAALTGLSQAADTVRTFGAESDKLCREFLRQGASRLADKEQA
jgi:hypothetical protein